MIGCVLQSEIRLRYGTLQRDSLQTPANVSNLTASELPSFRMHLESTRTCDLIYRKKLRERDGEIEEAKKILHFAPNPNAR